MFYVNIYRFLSIDGIDSGTFYFFYKTQKIHKVNWQFVLLSDIKWFDSIRFSRNRHELCAGCRASRLQTPVHQKIFTVGYSRRSCHGRRFVSCYRSWGKRSSSLEILETRDDDIQINEFTFDLLRGPCPFSSQISSPIGFTIHRFFNIPIILLAYIFSMDCISWLDGRVSSSMYSSRYVSKK